MLKLLKTFIVVNTVVTVLLTCVTSTEVIHKDKYMEKFHERLHKLLQSQNITEYAIVGQIKRACNGCITTFWSGAMANSKVPTTAQDEIGDIIYKNLATSVPASLMENSPNAASEPNDMNNEIPSSDGATQSESEESESYSTEQTSTEKIIATNETLHSPTEKLVQAPFHDIHHNKEQYRQAEIVCPNGTENQLQNGGTLKFEYMLLSAAFLYVMVVTLVYLTVFCGRTKGYQSGIGSRSISSGSGSDV